MRYRLTGSLEGGALSELFAATGDDRFPLAMKLFFAHTTDRAYAREIGRIAQRVNQLNRPGLVRVYEVGLIKDRLAVVRDALNGSTLAQLLARLGKRENFISTSLSFSFLIDYLELLQHAHEGGVIHGSLTPGNLQLLNTGTVAVCDFGAIQAIRHSPKLQRYFSTGGRDVYRAPELLAGEPPTEASDIYSLAAVGYELLTLKEPRPEGGDFRRGAIVPPSRVDRRLTPRVDSILMRALDPQPGRRFARCVDFAEALRELVAVSGGGVTEDERQRAAQAGGTAVEEGLGPVPFAEAFTLDEASVFRLPDESLALHTGPRMGGAAAELHRDGMPYDDDTDPEPTAATEGAWDAPPGVVSGLRRRLLGQPSSSRPIRVKWVQDLSAPMDDDEDTIADPGSADTSVAPRRRRRNKKAASVIPVHFPRRETSDDVARPAGRAPGRPRMLTPPPRRTLWPREVPIDWRWPAGILGAGFLVLLGAWVGRVWHAETVAPDAARLPDTIEVQKVAPPPPERDLGFDLPPSTGGASLSVLTNLPARVYIDGRLVKRLAPMDRYPVRLGMHRVVVEALATQERQEEVINFVKGSMQSMDATFGEAP